MSLQKLQFTPGIVRDTTDYTNEGGWRDGDKIRFRMGYPETIGGWAKLTTTTLLGSCRSLHVWATLTGTNYIAAGTNLKLYLINGSNPVDITPIRLTTSGTATFAATNGSSIITVTDALNGVYLHDFVTFSGADSLGGVITAEVLNQEYKVTDVIDANNYTILASIAADASDTGDGGASVVAAYQITTGLDTVVLGAGWGAGVWSRGTWGSGTDTSIPGAQLRLWSMDNFGEDLLANIRQGGIYYWDVTGGINSRAVNIADLAGANSVPTVANVVLVSERDRHVIAFGCDPEFDPGVQDPLIIRFSTQESITDWETRADNTAGELRIGTGTEIVAAVQTKQQVVVITDNSVSAMQYIGPPYTFSLNEVSSNTSIVSQNAAVAIGDAVYWMGDRVFYKYDGNVQLLQCPVKEYIFANMNVYQLGKVVTASNSKFHEIWWFYPSKNSSTNDSYVVLNYQENVWYFGTMARTAWHEQGVSGYPISASVDGYIYYQEYGLNDGSVNPAIGINSYIQSSAIDVGDGDQFMFVSRVLPDITFRNSTGNPTATFTIEARDFPGADFDQVNAKTVTRTATVPVQQYTDQLFVRLRGRSMALTVSSTGLNTEWRLGTPRFDMRTDGRR
tara:strand:+ start:189 stop:2045 length:1857 start_codon:yes stop_codon:yes gene_type:complete